MGISRVARKWASPNLSFGDFARIDSLIAGPHAQSVMYNLVATSRGLYYSQDLKERLGSFVAYQDLALDLDRLRRWHTLNRSLYLGYKVHVPGRAGVGRGGGYSGLHHLYLGGGLCDLPYSAEHGVFAGQSTFEFPAQTARSPCPGNYLPKKARQTGEVRQSDGPLAKSRLGG